MPSIYKRILKDLLGENNSTHTIKREIVERSRNVAYLLTSLGLFIIFRMCYTAAIYRYRVGILEEELKYMLESNEYKAYGTIFIFTVGFLLFLLKKKNQLLYGVSETAFAVATTYTIVDNTQRALSKGKIDVYVFLPVMTTLYLIVRGITNTYEGYEKRRKKILSENIS